MLLQIQDSTFWRSFLAAKIKPKMFQIKRSQVSRLMSKSLLRKLRRAINSIAQLLWQKILTLLEKCEWWQQLLFSPFKFTFQIHIDSRAWMNIFPFSLAIQQFSKFDFIRKLIFYVKLVPHALTQSTVRYKLLSNEEQGGLKYFMNFSITLD